MKKTSSPIVFFGSGPVAARSLELLHATLTIEAVVTKPRPPHHKGEVPVLNVVERLELPVFTAQNKKELDTLLAKKPFRAELGILIDFGIIVSREVISYFPLGIVNSHFSLLPAWRGADPITFAILSGDKRTGVSLMLLVEGMDEGPILAQETFDLQRGITTPELTKKLIQISYEALQKTIPAYIDGRIRPVPQSNEKATYSRRLTKDDGIINWNKSAAQLEREIRAFAGWPKSRTSFGSLEVVITKARIMDAQNSPGTREIVGKEPVVYCGDGALVIEKLKPAGKQEMTGKAFLAGYSKLFLQN